MCIRDRYRYDPATQEYKVASTKTDTYRGDVRNHKVEMMGQFTLNYDHIFAKDHHVTAVAGFEFFKEDRKYLTVAQSPVENPFVENITTNANNTVSNSVRTITTCLLYTSSTLEESPEWWSGLHDSSTRYRW